MSGNIYYTCQFYKAPSNIYMGDSQEKCPKAFQNNFTYFVIFFYYSYSYKVLDAENISDQTNYKFKGQFIVRCNQLMDQVNWKKLVTKV